jgi:hypothetical protein
LESGFFYGRPEVKVGKRGNVGVDAFSVLYLPMFTL